MRNVIYSSVLLEERDVRDGKGGLSPKPQKTVSQLLRLRKLV